MRIANILAAGLAVLGATQACETDEDCSLNDVCSRKPTKSLASKPRPGACKCDPGWFGDDCGRLDLAPATPINVITTPTPWIPFTLGHTEIRPGEDRSYRIRTTANCSISSPRNSPMGVGWRRPSSYIMRAESRTGPQRPYHYADAVTESFRHNPSVIGAPQTKNIFSTLSVLTPLKLRNARALRIRNGRITSLSQVHTASEDPGPPTT